MDKWFVVTATKLYTNIGKEPNAEMIDEMYQNFKNLSETQWHSVCETYWKSSTHYPAIASLIEIARGKGLLGASVDSVKSTLTVVACPCGQEFALTLEMMATNDSYACPGKFYGKCNRSYTAGFFRTMKPDWRGVLVVPKNAETNVYPSFVKHYQDTEAF